MRRSGFTLIELIFVIVILGILAATALPRFVGINDDARISAEQAVIGGARGAFGITRSRWLIESNGTNADWDNDGTGEHFSANGHLNNLQTGTSLSTDTATGTNLNVFTEVLQEAAADWSVTTNAANNFRYKGPASVLTSSITDPHDLNRSGSWRYEDTNGTLRFLAD